MSNLSLIALGSLFPAVLAAQTATVIGQVRMTDGGQALGFTTVSILPRGPQLLTNESGRFLLRDLPGGEVHVRFKRIGYAPRDTTVTVAVGDTARIEIGMRRLVIQLPAMMVSGKCTNEAPTQPQPAVLAELFDQVNQNAERMRLFAKEKPFLLDVFRMRGYRSRGDKIVPTRVDTVVRRPLPPEPYQPKRVIQRGEGRDADGWVLALPELPDFADSAFTNNHCFRYAGQTRYGADSVIQVDFEPVPWLDKEVDIEGTMYLRADGYQLVATITKLNKVPGQFRRSGLEEVTVRARFSEIATGVAVLDEWEMTTRYRYPQPSRVEMGQVFSFRWTDSTLTKIDTLPAGKPPR